MMKNEKCKYCGEEDMCGTHPGLCCSHFDLEHGTLLETVNKMRKGKPPLVWPVPVKPTENEFGEVTP